MRVVAAATDPDKIEVSLTITMPLAQWKALSDQLPQRHPASELDHRISRIIHQCTRNFHEVNANG